MTADRILRAIDATLTATEAPMTDQFADGVDRLAASLDADGAAPYDTGDAAPRRHIALTPPTADEQNRALTAELHRHHTALRKLEVERDDLRIQLATATEDRNDARAALRTAHRTLARLWALGEQWDRIWADHDTIAAPAQNAAEPPHSTSGGTEAHDGPAEAHRGAEGADVEPKRTPRQLLDQAIDAALPQAGGRVRKLLKALRRELADVDTKRAAAAAATAATLAQIARDAAQSAAGVAAGRVSDHLGDPPPVHRGYHWGRAWGPTQDEATCPCPKAPCGYVIRSSEPTDCDLHGLTQTMRGGHPADRCPGKREG